MGRHMVLRLSVASGAKLCGWKLGFAIFLLYDVRNVT